MFFSHIKNKFEAPIESSFSYISEDRKNKSTTELTKSLMRDPINDTKRLREKIGERNEMIHGWDEKDSCLTT